jgi:hypothetical protein
MSDIRTEAKPASFFDLYSRGDVSADDIDDFVGRWHDNQELWARDMSVEDYLGLRHDEYQVWVYDPEALRSILTARRAQRPLQAVMAERLEELVAAGRPHDETIIKGLRVWVAGQARD